MGRLDGCDEGWSVGWALGRPVGCAVGHFTFPEMVRLMLLGIGMQMALQQLLTQQVLLHLQFKLIQLLDLVLLLIQAQVLTLQ